jgi:murein DD-endopeptidase MepM/ murein hydrolase activator NlpD
LALGTADAVRAAPAQRPQVSLLEARVETGGVLAVRLDLRRQAFSVREVRVAYGDQPVVLFPHPGGEAGVYAGFVAIALGASPGKSGLVVEWPEGGGRRSERIGFEIIAGRYGTEVLKVDPRHVKPSPEDLERIRREQDLLRRVYASGSPQILWRGTFQNPVPGEINGPFGTRRLFNGELRSQHTGLDFRAGTGDPVRAANAGVVRLAEELFYSGNAVVVDHGAGVFTSYSHLSRISVAVGQTVEKGQVVGLAGATGRATGPHLHWGVKVNSVSVDPQGFVSLIGRIARDSRPVSFYIDSRTAFAYRAVRRNY